MATVGDDGEVVAVGQVEDGTAEEGRADGIFAADGVDGIEAQGGEDEP